MPEFLEDFASLVNSKKYDLKEKILHGIPNQLQDRFRKYFDSYWISDLREKIVPCSLKDIDVMAIDSSLYTNLLSTGGLFYIVRSMAACREKTRKVMETDVIFSKDELSKIRYLIGRKMELLEFQVAINSIKNGINCEAVLLDGSLYGRAIHNLIETKSREEIPTLLKYFQVYNELLDLCKEKNILLVGVSKQSRSTFFRDFLLRLIFIEELEKSDLSPEMKRQLDSIFFGVLDVEKKALRRFDLLKRKQKNGLEEIEMMFEELSSSRSDYQLVMNFANSIGFTKPLLLGPSARMARFFKRFQFSSKTYVQATFPRTTREKGDDFVEWASQIISKIPDFPSFVSFHLLLDERDSPLRIDVPNWDYKISEIDWPKPVDVNLENLLKIMITGYCGLDGYNLWLKDVDQKVRLKKRVVDQIYFPYMEKIFKEKIIRGRSYRRVRYP
jgi:hypothetical protein